MSYSKFPRSSLLLLLPNSIQSLVPSTITSQLEALLDSHRLEDAYNLIDERRKKMEESLEVDVDEAEELRYSNQLIGFQCFRETLFEDAGKHLINGELDPRLLISYYPDLRGNLFKEEDTIDVFAGVQEKMPTEGSVDDIIRNYSPHLAPSTLDAPPTAELRKILGMAAREMLLGFLKKTRTRRELSRVGGGGIGEPVDIAIDTVLVKLYAEFEKTAELYALLASPNDVSLPEVESTLKQLGQYNALIMLYKQRAEEANILDVLARLIEGTYTDHDIHDPTTQMISILTEKRDKALTQKWGIWLTKRDAENGLKLLMPRDNGKRRDKPEEDLALLVQLEHANPIAAAKYLEYLVLQRKSTSRELHTKLAEKCVEEVLDALKNENVSKLWRAKASSYASSPSPLSTSNSASQSHSPAKSPTPAYTSNTFLQYFSSTTPDSSYKRARLKCIIMLAGSGLYDVNLIREKIRTCGKEVESILSVELVVLEGKLANHRPALSILAHTLGDTTAAEMYCTLGGDIVPPKIALAIADSCALNEWSAAFFGMPPFSSTGPASVGSGVKGTTANVTGIPLMTRTKTVNEELKKKLLKILLEVYMYPNSSESEGASRGRGQRQGQGYERAAALLNAQGTRLDVEDVISLIPSAWPLLSMSSFLSRSFRRTVHAKQEGKIVKWLSAGENLAVKDTTYTMLQEAGAIVEEELESDDEDDAGDSEKGRLLGDTGGVPQSFDEKRLLAAAELEETRVHDINVEDDREHSGLR